MEHPPITLRPQILSRGRHWITIALLALVVGVVAYRFSQAEWLSDTLPLVVMVVLAAGYGLGLAVSRYARPATFVLSSLTSVGFGLIVVGRILPTLGFAVQHPLVESMRLMNGRLLLLLTQIWGQMGRLAGDAQWPSDLLSLIGALCAWQIIASLIWGALHRGTTGVALLACVGLLLANDVLAGREPKWSLWLTLGSVLLLAVASHNAKIDAWDRRGVGYPDLIAEDWLIAATLIAAVVVTATGLSTPQWRTSIDRFIDSLDRERATVGANAESSRGSGVGQFASSFVPRMSLVGAPFPSGDEPVFYVTTSDEPSGVEANGAMRPPRQQHYWRGAIYDRYTGSGWELMPIGAPAQSPADAGGSELGRYPLEQQFEILARGEDRLLAANQPVAASGQVTLGVSASDGFSALPRGTSTRYTIRSLVSNATAMQLRGAGVEYPQAIRDAYLLLPESVPQRVRSLAERITLGAMTPYDKALQVQTYLRATYPYKQDVPPPPGGRDVVDYFLFDARAGFCSYYASAMTVLLRTQGVPARVVTGFAMGEWEGSLRRYRVPVSAAHSWVEVYFPAFGWIEFEPTPSQSEFVHAAGEPIRPTTEVAAASGSGAITIHPPLAWLTLALGLAAAIGVAAAVRHQHRWMTLERNERLRRMYWGMRRGLARVGLEGGASVTAAEFLSRHAPRLAAWPRLDRAARRMTALYIRAAYTAIAPSDHDVTEAGMAWRTAWLERARLAWTRAGRTRT